MSMGDSNTGIDFWIAQPVKDLREWLELMNDYYKRQSDALKKKSK